MLNGHFREVCLREIRAVVPFRRVADKVAHPLRLHGSINVRFWTHRQIFLFTSKIDWCTVPVNSPAYEHEPCLRSTYYTSHTALQPRLLASSRLHPYRVAGRHSDHCNFGGDALAGVGPGKTQSAEHSMHVE